ncbi:MAG: dTDP-glucose 4,6-dehydratase [Planctomycetota bacterium]|nr:MAG: dTDP-glucose 4,6-dehydratase [Planctomycetota bacterium]
MSFRPDLAGRRLLVTGGAGFIGSAFVRVALAAGAGRVVVLDALTYAAQRESLDGPDRDERFAFRVGDVRRSEDCAAALAAAEPDWVVHLAAESHVDRSIERPAPFLETNVLGTAVLLEACLRWAEQAGREPPLLIHSSTDEVFGDLPEGVRATEDSPYRPGSPYAAAKAAADHLVRAWGRTYGLRWRITHSGNNYGPRQFPEKLIPLALLRALAGEPAPLYGDGGQIRDWIHVEDHARAILAAGLADGGGRAFCVGAGEERTNTELLGLLAEALPAGTPPLRIEHVADRPGHDRRYALDPSRLIRETGWRPTRGLAEGLAETVRWYRENPEWIARARARSGYRGERLGLGLRRP